MTSRAITRTMMSSIGPMLLNGMEVPFGGGFLGYPAVSLAPENEEML